MYKKKSFLKNSFIIICASFFIIAGCKEENIKTTNLNEINFEKTNLTIISDSKEHVFNIEIADTEEKKKQGLMFRTKLKKNEGMIFDFGETKPVSMWMKNTYIPLDMIFISEEGKILDFIENAKPLSETILTPKFAARYALEVNGGTVKKLGLNVGDSVICDVIKQEI